MNEDSKALYHELVKGKIIPKIKEVNDYELTQEEIDLICIHLDKEIKDLNHHIEHEKCIRLRKQARQKRTKIKRYKRYAYRYDKYVFRKDFKLYECDNCSECPLKNRCMKPNSKSNKKIMRNYNWEYFKAHINQNLLESETKEIYNQGKLM